MGEFIVATLVVVLTVSTVVTALLPLGVTVCGLKEQVTPAGCPEQENVIGLMNPLLGVTVKFNVVDCPAVTVALAEFVATAKSGDCEVTTCASAEDTLPPKLASPPYTAVIEWLPGVSVVAVKVACKAPERLAVPRVELPSLNVIVPVGVPLLALTLAVKVTASLKPDGFTFDVTAVDVGARTA